MRSLLSIYFVLIFLALIIIQNNSYGQFFLYSSEAINVDAEFLRKSIETESKKSFFNVLTIKNNGNNAQTLTLNITIPEGWSVLGQEQQEIFLQPQDSIIIPIRISAGGMAKGDIGYSVIASLSDTRGNTIKNEYCFVKIKSKKDLRVSIPIGVNYLDQITGHADFTVYIFNNGNREEIVNFVFDLERGLGFGDLMLDKYATDVSVRAFSDTTISYRVRIKKGLDLGRESYRLKFQALSTSLTHSQTIWFRSLDSEFKNYIPPSDKALVIDLSAQGLLSQGRRPNYSTIFEGKVLLKNNNDIYYHYRNFASNNVDDLYKYNHMNVGTNIRNWNIEIGDTYKSHESSLQGRGATLGYQYKGFWANLIGNTNQRNNSENLALLLGNRLQNGTHISLAGIYNYDEFRNIKSTISTLGSKFACGVHHFDILAAINPLNQTINEKVSHIEYSGELNYRSTFDRFNNSFRVRYGSPHYYGHFQGRLQLIQHNSYTINNEHTIALSTNINNNKRPTFSNNNLLFFNETSNLRSYLYHTYDVSPRIRFYYGPLYELFSQTIPNNNLIFDKKFSSDIKSVQAGARFRFDDPFTSLSPKLTIGNVNILDFPLIYGDNYADYTGKRNFFIYYFDITFRSRNFNLLTSYESGPRQSYTQFNYFYGSRNIRTMRINPSYSRFIYKDIIYTDIGVSYNSDMILNQSYINTSLNVTWYLPNDWSARVNSFYSRTNRMTSSGLESFQSLYIEAGIRKEFNLPHPRVAYHNINLIIFKDFNGNSVQEPNEPGIKNLLVSLTKESISETERIPGNISYVEILSDNFGRVSFENIPTGVYSVNFVPLGNEVGTYTSAFENYSINLTQNSTIYVPFVERNKVFGKIILNRSRLSGLGRLDLSNVRVTATDSQGRSYSTLTDKNGEFVLFAPVTDEYILTINNIYYENFDLRQNSFLVQFNGYKQFEVNFVFDEKVRRINFAATDQDMQQGVQQVRRTTISGSVKDANTQQAIRARVNLINTRTNAIVASVNSSATSGDYTLNFMASDDYLLEVLADDYWYFSENLVLQQVTTFMNINRNIQLKPISVGSSIELNIQFGANSDYLAPESVAELNRLLRQVRNNPTVRLEIQGHCDDLEAIQKPDIGRDRAGAVAKYLIENGFSNVEVKDMKNNVPLTSNDTEEGRARNRRIDVVVLRR